MESKIKDLRQQLFNFKFNKSLNSNDFFISDSNFYAYNLLISWPKWEKKIINIFGERYSGKTHLIEIFLEKNQGLKVEQIVVLNVILTQHLKDKQKLGD